MAKPQITIYINGDEHNIEKRRYEYSEIYALAYPGKPIPTDPNDVANTIKYDFANGRKHGTLRPGESLEVLNGMSFDVTDAYKS